MLTTRLIALGFTRDDVMWFWSRLVSGSAVIASGVLPLDNYMSPADHKLVTVAAALVLWLAGGYGNSPLPGKKVNP